MLSLTAVLRSSKHIVAVVLWMGFLGWAVWQHAQQSDQPPIYDAATYYQKAHNFWTKIHQPGLFNPFNVAPSFRPPGTILMSYPFGFDTDYRGFYFRSVFFPIGLLGLAVFVAGYRRDLNSKSKWYLALFAAFLSTLPAFYFFEVSPEFPAPSYWGLVDNFLGGVAALAAAAAVRSVWTRSLAWLGFAAILSSICVLIKPTGLIVMLIIGVIWFGLTTLQLRSDWLLPEERKQTIRWLLRGSITLGIPYLAVVVASFSSDYLSVKNLAFGTGAIVIMQTEQQLSWPALQGMVHMGIGYPFVAWLLLTILFVASHSWRPAKVGFPFDRPQLVGLGLASCFTFAFGIWFWLFGSGGIYQIRYFIPFALMAAIFALPAILPTVQEMRPWKMLVLILIMTAPAINIGMLLVQRNPSTAWQQWTGVNLTSGRPNGDRAQAEKFVDTIKREGRDVTVYSMSMNVVNADFQAVVDYSEIASPRKPLLSIRVPGEWVRPTAFRTEEMLDADYWLFEPVRDPRAASAAFAMPSINDIAQERLLFQAWATQLTTNEGVAVVSETPTARILRIADPKLLESALDALIAKHRWRSTFTEANARRRLNEKELATALALTPAILENVNFSDRFKLRALSAIRTGSDVTVRIWWKPLSPLPEHDWAFFIHSINDEGKIMADHYVSFKFNRPLSSLDGTVLFDQITFKNPSGNRSHRLAVGMVRPGQPLLIADKGTRDWNNSRVIVPLP